MSESREMPEAETTQAQVVIDPVCGMSVDPRRARGVAQYQGERYYFCSPGCMHRFVFEPAKFLSARYKPVPSDASNSPVQIAPARKVQKDPVCGMTVDASKASASIEHEGTLYHFCSKGCGEKFKADPEKFLSPKYKPAGMGATSQAGGNQTATAREVRA